MTSHSSVESMLAESVESLLAGHCGLQLVRRIEAGASADALWRLLSEAGYLDALVPAQQEGSGLTLTEASAIVHGCGRHVLPLPLAQTMVVRAALAERGIAAPAGPISIASTAAWGADGTVQAHGVPCVTVAQWVLLGNGQSDMLLPLVPGVVTRAPDASSGSVRWDALPPSTLHWARAGDAALVDWQATAAALVAAQIAAALERVCAMTIAYANERVQFGKPIGKLQVVQQQISVLAEQTAAARCAARIGLLPAAGSAWRVDPLRAAVAKARASEAVAMAASIAHAVHGAIGISEEYDLQMLTRHLHGWRLQYGSESFWNARIGAVLLHDERPALQFIQQCVAQPVLPQG